MVTAWGDFDVDLSDVLGRGGMGTVYRARQRSLNRTVAVKVLEPGRTPDPELIDGFRAKFQLEIRALSQLRDPRIVTILQAGENDGRFWYAMELIEGRTVEQALFDDGALSVAEASRIGAEVARALEAAWQQGITHRDVKPGNVFLTADGSVKLADFGLARSDAWTRTRLTDLHAVACTPAYASPEQVEGRETDHRSDLYSLGCVLYEMVTERPPFEGQSPMEPSRRRTSEAPRSLRLLNPSVPPEFEQVVLRCLKPDPEDRFQTHGELIQALRLPPEAPAPRNRFWPWAVAAAMALVGAAVTALSTDVKAPPPPDAAPPAAALLPAEPEIAREAPIPDATPVEVAKEPPVLPPEPPETPPPPDDPEPAAPEPVPEPPDPEALAEALYEAGENRRLLAEAFHTAAGRRVAAEELERFRNACEALRRSTPPQHDDFSELVGMLSWPTWHVDRSRAPQGDARLDRGRYLLAAPGPAGRLWFAKKLRGARQGYGVKWRFANPGAVFVVAISPTRWIEFTGDSAVLRRDDGYVEEAPPHPEGECVILPALGRILVFRGETLLWSLPEEDYALDEGIRLGVGGGMVGVESIRVTDRSRD